MTDTLHISLEGYEGPLDLLLELARSQKVDIAKISILGLVDQYLLVIEGARRVRLELAADWLVMAAWLAWLKSRLLLPQDPEQEEDAEALAGQLAERLVELERMRAASRWLATQPQLGHDVFPRGLPESFTVADRSTLSTELPSLLRGYVDALRRAAAKRPYRPKPRKLWTVQDALERLARLVGGLPDWGDLLNFMPEQALDPIERRAAMASTLIAGLELAKGGGIELRQETAFGPILLRRNRVQSVPVMEEQDAAA
jgi:segregation and condensation protein A